MEVIVNNELQTLENECSLQNLLIQKELFEQKGIAIAVNNKVVSRKDWEQTILLANDKITVIKATQGG